MSENSQSTQKQHAREATIARVALPATGFALATLFERVPDAQTTLESAVASADGRALLVIRTETAPWKAVIAALRADPSVSAVEYLTNRSDGWLFWIEWAEQPRQFVQRVLVEDATILSARGWNGDWTFELLLPDRDALTRAYDAINDCECGTELEHIGSYSDSGGEFDLTDEQREALVTAFKAGYYDIPRDLTSADLAAKIDISHQALSERLRRGYGNLVAGIVTDGREHE
jgi:predicted DNA binding protein